MKVTLLAAISLSLSVAAAGRGRGRGRGGRPKPQPPTGPPCGWKGYDLGKPIAYDYFEDKDELECAKTCLLDSKCGTFVLNEDDGSCLVYSSGV